MTLLHLTAGVAMIVCPQCRRRVALVHDAGDLRIGQHAMPKPSNERWVEGAACPASGESVGRVQAKRGAKMSDEAKFVPWAEAGGPNECKHGYAAGIPCPQCTKAAPQPSGAAMRVDPLIVALLERSPGVATVYQVADLLADRAEMVKEITRLQRENDEYAKNAGIGGLSADSPEYLHLVGLEDHGCDAWLHAFRVFPGDEDLSGNVDSGHYTEVVKYWRDDVVDRLRNENAALTAQLAAVRSKANELERGAT